MSNITLFISKSMLKWIIFSLIIGIPITWSIINLWLQNFAYKINLSWWIFVLAGGLAFVIALITVSSQTIKAANRNPVESLRME